ncbi:MAG: 50S ribosome-binding GTPase [bacterium]|nr:50S ribosome-binding GTPase [bacterium]
MIKCQGCGVLLQTTNPAGEGYIINIDQKVCQRCFKIINYNQCQKAFTTNREYIAILKQIPSVANIILVESLLTPHNLTNILKYITSKNITLVLTKKDLLPKSFKAERIIAYYQKIYPTIKNIFITSSIKNYNLEQLFTILKNKVYVIGYVNSGKSTFINKILTKYYNNSQQLTTSIFPSTTVNINELPINDSLTIYDTPGIIENEELIDELDIKQLKEITPKKTIKPRIYQIKNDTSILVGDYLRIDCHPITTTSLIFYIANDIKVQKISHKNLTLNNSLLYNIDIDDQQDLIINPFGFIKNTSKCQLTIKSNKKISPTVRPSLF